MTLRDFLKLHRLGLTDTRISILQKCKSTDYTLYVNGTAYTEGSSSTGESITFTSSSSGSEGQGGKPGDGNEPPGKPGE